MTVSCHDVEICGALESTKLPFTDLYVDVLPLTFVLLVFPISVNGNRELHRLATGTVIIIDVDLNLISLNITVFKSYQNK